MSLRAPTLLPGSPLFGTTEDRCDYEKGQTWTVIGKDGLTSKQAWRLKVDLQECLLLNLDPRDWRSNTTESKPYTYLSELLLKVQHRRRPQIFFVTGNVSKDLIGTLFSQLELTSDVAELGLEPYSDDPGYDPFDTDIPYLLMPPLPASITHAKTATDVRSRAYEPMIPMPPPPGGYDYRNQYAQAICRVIHVDVGPLCAAYSEDVRTRITECLNFNLRRVCYVQERNPHSSVPRLEAELSGLAMHPIKHVLRFEMFMVSQGLNDSIARQVAELDGVVGIHIEHESVIGNAED